MATKWFDSIILGGGISGLSAAFYMKTLAQQTEKVFVTFKTLSYSYNVGSSYANVMQLE